MNLKQFHSAAIRQAENYYNHNHDLPASLFALQANGSMFLCHKQFHDYVEKEFVFNLYAVLLKLKKVTMYSFMSESWFVRTTDKNLDIPPSEHPNKKECLFIYTVSKNKNIFTMFEISHNEKINLVPIDYVDVSMSDGTITKLFNRLDNNPKLNELINELKKIESTLDFVDWYKTIDSEIFLKGVFND